jgi:SAM-dependent methyltransferase
MAHFKQFGQKEGRRQFTREFLDARDRVNKEKYQRWTNAIDFMESYRFLENEDAFPISFGTKHFDIADYDAESANGTWDVFAGEIRQNPGKLYMDVGAGLRNEVFDNCLYAEVYPSITADILVEPGRSYPLESDSLDGIGCFAVLEHVAHPWELIEEIKRMIKPGGKVFIDWPFLQPVHGYPSHYFNATRYGLEWMFSREFEFQSCRTEAYQTPAFTITWIVGKFLNDLPPEKRSAVESMTVRDLVSQPPLGQFWQELLAGLSDKTISEFAAGNTLVATKR